MKTNRRCAREILTNDKNSTSETLSKSVKHRLNRSVSRETGTRGGILRLSKRELRVSLHLDQKFEFGNERFLITIETCWRGCI